MDSGFGSLASISYAGDDASVNGINNYGTAVGSTGFGQGFIYNGIGLTPLSVPGASTFVEGINDRGDIVGSYSFGRADYGFLYTGGAFVGVNVPGALSTLPSAVPN